MPEKFRPCFSAWVSIFFTVALLLLQLPGCGSSTVDIGDDGDDRQQLQAPTLPKYIHVVSPELGLEELEGKLHFAYVHTGLATFNFTSYWTRFPMSQDFYEWAHDISINLYRINGELIEDLWENYHFNFVGTLDFEPGQPEELPFVTGMKLEVDFGTLPDWGDESYLLELVIDAIPGVRELQILRFFIRFA